MSGKINESDLLEKNLVHENERYDHFSGYEQDLPQELMHEDAVDIKSEEVRELMGNPPHWIVRSGIMMIAIAFVIILSGSYVVHYPDTLPTEVTIVTEAMPTSVKAKHSGKLTHLFVKENQIVNKDQYLGILENPVPYQDLALVRSWFDQFQRKLHHDEEVGEFYNGPAPNLGNLQSGYAAIKTAWKDLILWEEQAINQLKKEQLTRQIAVQEQLRISIEQKIDVNQQTFGLSEKKFLADKKLYQEGIIAEQEYDNSEKTFLNEKLTLANLENERASQLLQIESLNQQIIELEQQTTLRKTQIIDAIRQAAISFQNQITEWEDRYVLKAATDGSISFYKFWTQNQEIVAGDEVMVVIPDSNELFAYSYLNAENSGKVQVGQKVRIELNDFPFQEFGYVYGYIVSKSDISRDSKYFLRIDMPEGLMTKDGVHLPFSQEMQGSANIITEDLRLLERFLKALRGKVAQFR